MHGDKRVPDGMFSYVTLEQRLPQTTFFLGAICKLADGVALAGRDSTRRTRPRASFDLDRSELLCTNLLDNNLLDNNQLHFFENSAWFHTASSLLCDTI
jgi:hypothetical protein